MFIHNFEVRDHELDIQGIVNNIYYFAYLMHARHKYLHHLGLDFAEFTARGQNFTLLATTTEYKHSLRSGDLFYVTCSPQAHKSKTKFIINQEIYLQGNNKLVLTSQNLLTCINTKAQKLRDKFYIPAQILQLLATSKD